MKWFGRIFTDNEIFDFEITDADWDGSGLFIPIFIVSLIIGIYGPYLVWQQNLPTLYFAVIYSSYLKIYLALLVLINIFLVLLKVKLRTSLILIFIYSLLNIIYFYITSSDAFVLEDGFELIILFMSLMTSFSLSFQTGLKGKYSLLTHFLMCLLYGVVLSTIIYDLVYVFIIRNPFSLSYHVFVPGFLFTMFSIIPSIIIVFSVVIIKILSRLFSKALRSNN